MEDGLEARVKSGVRGFFDKEWLLNTTAAWFWYTPVVTGVEFISGMESMEVLKSRLIGMGVHATIMKPYGKLRKRIAARLKGDQESSPVKKGVIDIASMLVFQEPIYAGMLYVADVSFEEAKIVYPSGLVMGAIQGYLFGPVLDNWKKLFGERGLLY